MKNLRRKYTEFLSRNRNKGIPHLLLAVAIGQLIVYFLLLADKSGLLKSVLLFDRDAIFQGEVWRLISYIVLPVSSNPVFAAVFVMFYYFIEKALTQSIGRLRVNLYYFFTILVLDCAAFFLLPGQALLPLFSFAELMPLLLDFSLIFAFAVVSSYSTVYLFFVIPLKMKYLAWIELGWIVYYMIIYPFPVKLLPPVCLLPCILFFGRNLRELLPDPIKERLGRGRVRKARVISQPTRSKKAYRQKCTVCGRTDTDYPDLEFRYCSRCKGFHCYCMDHINNHIHITEEAEK